MQIVDLATTYSILSDGGREGNTFMQPFILTPIAPVLKAFALVFLALLIVGSSARGRPSPHRLLRTIWVILVVYCVVVLNNVMLLLLP